MHTITFKGRNIQCPPGENLRKILLENNLPLYNGNVKLIHCRGLGTCGTCAVKVQGEMSPKTRIEKWRLNFPPHSDEQGLRLACQVEVEGDLVVEKLDGIWGTRE